MKRYILRKGTTNVALNVDEIVYFYREKSIVIAVDQKAQKYLCDKNLSALEDQLCKEVFFRANRKFLINVHFVRSFKTFERVKLAVKLSAASDERIIISQEKARHFKKWIYEEAY
jgi:DNA-binding LytR/AlgR family response regulator